MGEVEFGGVWWGGVRVIGVGGVCEVRVGGLGSEHAWRNLKVVI